MRPVRNEELDKSSVAGRDKQELQLFKMKLNTRPLKKDGDQVRCRSESRNELYPRAFAK